MPALCPICEVSSPGDTCSGCGGALELGDGFRLQRLLGAGGQSRVYLASDRHGAKVALKIMSMARAHDLKSIELFRRSAKVLEGLAHPGVMRLLAYFEEVRPSAALYCIATELVNGETLDHRLAHGERLDESAVKTVARQVLGVLGYLHGLSPPVIHRDLKPSNLMQRKDGSLVLIDFDLVRDVLRPDGGSTMSLGTPGYTPMEQYLGDASPATDLYALGVTLTVLLSRKDALELRRGGDQRLVIRDQINASDGFARILERLTEPDVAERYATADEVVRDLDDLDARPAPRPSQRSAAPRRRPVSATLEPAPQPARPAREAPAPGYGWLGYVVPGIAIMTVLAVLWLRHEPIRDAAPAPQPAAAEPEPDPEPPDLPVQWIFSAPAGLEFTKSEITVGQYDQCVRAGECQPGSFQRGETWNSCSAGYQGLEAHPMNCVTWQGAAAFCDFAKARLPTALEWRAEASDGGKRERPWGSAPPSCELVTWGDGKAPGSRGCGKDRPSAVCQRPAGNSVSGLCDMAGNVAEWTTTPADAGIGTDGGTDTDGGQPKLVVVGGSWFDNGPTFLRAAGHYAFAPTKKDDEVGFRCVRPPSPAR